MKRITGVVVVALLIVFAGCAAKYRTVMIPPRIDLSKHQMIGVVEFESTNEGELGPLATRRFTDSARRDQGLIRIVGLAPEGDQVDPERARQLGREHGLRTIVVGRLTVSDVRPSLSIETLSSGSLSASVEATLVVELIETSSGASLWSASARATRSVGNISVFAKQVRFDAEDPDQAYGALVDALVAQVTSDFQASWRRHPTR